jgi:hypothetical protein
MKTKIQSLFTALALLAGASQAAAQGTAFTYQGQLQNNGSPANGLYDFQFALSNAPSGGSQVGGTVTNLAVGVTNGLFKTILDFGSVFSGNATWLAISVRTNDVGSYIGLNPPQQLSPVPYAIFANSASNVLGALPAMQLSGTIPLAQLPGAVLTNNSTGVNLVGIFSGNGSGLTNLQTANLTGTVADDQLSANIARLNIANTNLQATATANLPIGGFITLVNVTFGGSGYVTAPVVSFTGGGGSNVTATAYLNGGVVTNITVINPGAGYTSAPTVTVAPPPSSAVQMFTCGNLFTNVSNSFAGSFTGNGAGLTNLNLTGPSFGTALRNLANGYSALAANTSGSNNTANGYQALLKNTTGSENAASGIVALGNNTTGSGNTADGPYALYNNTSGGDNTATGDAALNHNSTGNNNTADGNGALFNNTTASGNTANGYEALWSNKTGTQNTASGAYSLTGNTTGSYNTASGFNALWANTTGTQNTANGWGALELNTSGNYNTAVGYQALYSNTNADNNTAIGYEALQANTTGYGNSAIGYKSLLSNTNGYQNAANGAVALYSNTSGTGNTANGWSALNRNTSGNNNTADGWSALYFNTTGSNNTANGFQSLFNNTNGSYNVADGVNALYASTSGTNNIALGYQAGSTITNGSSNIDIGNAGFATDNNVIRIGTSQTQTFLAGIISGNGGGLTNLPPGGSGNTIQSSATLSFIGGGTNNNINSGAAYSTIGGGLNNSISGYEAVVAGGANNSASAVTAFVGGGYFDAATGPSATVVGGGANTASGYAATIAGGWGNQATNGSSTVGGGTNNLAGGYGATVPGGISNIAGGDFSFAAGSQAQATNRGAFVWADSQGAAFASTANDQFLIRAQGGFGINTNNPQGAALNVNGAIVASGTVTANGVLLTSDRNAKENFTKLDGKTVLAKVAALPLTEWNYKDGTAEVRHVGPMAQDFHAAFGLDGKDDRHISVVDEGGVALAAIQGLNQKLEETEQTVKARDGEIQTLKQQNDSLVERLNDLEATVKQLAANK